MSPGWEGNLSPEQGSDSAVEWVNLNKNIHFTLTNTTSTFNSLIQARRGLNEEVFEEDPLRGGGKNIFFLPETLGILIFTHFRLI